MVYIVQALHLHVVKVELYNEDSVQAVNRRALDTLTEGLSNPASVRWLDDFVAAQ
jgi:hypothetical protein